MFDVLGAAAGVNRKNLIGNAWGGLAAMLVALPSSIAFGATIYGPLGGSLAAQGAMAGILGATALGLVAPLFGGSSRLITAPCAPAAAVLSALAVGFAQQKIPSGTILLMLSMIGLLAGLIQIGFGVAGIGRLIRFIPFPVVSGYLSGVGLIIIGGQVPKLLGASAGTSLLDALSAPSAWVWQGIVVGGVVMGTMVATPHFTRAIPAAIVALLAGMATYLGLGLLDPSLMRTEGNPLLIGALASGGSLTDGIQHNWTAMRGLGLEMVVKVFVPALTLAVLLSIDTLKTCVVIDAMSNSQHDSNRELVGQGLGNISSSLIGGIPGAGTMGASLINISSGGTGRLSGVMAGVLCLVAYFALAPLIAWIPIAALAGILIVIGFRMIDRHSLAFFFHPSTRFDFVVILAVILVAIFGNLIAASGVGVALAILLFIREQTRSSVIRSRVEGHEIFSRRSRSPEELLRLEHEGDGMVVFELQGSLFFGTASQLHAALEPETTLRKYVILSMRRVQSLDVTATHVLEQIKDRLEENNAFLVFCDIPKGLPSGLKMKRFLKDTGVVRPTNKAFAFRGLDDALEWVEARVLEDSANAIETVTYGVRDMPVFAGLGEATHAALEAVLEPRSVKTGKKVFKAGGPGDELFLVRHGLVKVTLPLGKKEHYHLTTAGPGEIVGAMGFLDGTPHAADAHALNDVEVYVLSRRDFDDLAKQHGAAALAIVETVASGLSSRLRGTIAELQALRG
jgi:SulP family sulfate permease